MKLRVLQIPSLTPGLQLEAAAAEPPDGIPIRAVLQISHGMCEHKERYLDFMEKMTCRGAVCVIHDHRGHGNSVMDHRDLGYMYQGGADLLVEELHLVTEYANIHWPEVPLWMLGHSMGSLAARVYLKKYDSELQGMVLTGSPSRNRLAGIGMGLARIQAACSGEGLHCRSRLLEGMAFGPFAAKFRKEKNRFSWCCSNPEIQKAYAEDPLCGFTFTADGFLTLGQLMKRTYDSKGWEGKNLSLPILFLSGEDDPCYRSRREFEQAAEHLKKQGYENVKTKLYPGMRHEILFEKDGQKAVEEICRWMGL